MSIPFDLYANFNFSRLNSPDFKEDSVREALIQPLLIALNYGESRPYKIIRSKTLAHPFIKIGSKKRAIKQIPDYLLEVDGKYAWVLDAKSPDEDVLNHEHQEQIYSYAIHPDVRVKWYALCNGWEFILFQIDRAEAVLYFQLSEIEQFWSQLQAFLAPAVFQPTPAPMQTAVKEKATFNYVTTKPPGEIKDLQKQSAKRHYGVHGYFTKQVWNVVQEYIKTFTQPGDAVLDPFGGSGVTVVEALLLGRKGTDRWRLINTNVQMSLL